MRLGMIEGLGRVVLTVLGGRSEVEFFVEHDQVCVVMPVHPGGKADLAQNCLHSHMSFIDCEGMIALYMMRGKHAGNYRKVSSRHGRVLSNRG